MFLFPVIVNDVLSSGDINSTTAVNVAGKVWSLNFVLKNKKEYNGIRSTPVCFQNGRLQKQLRQELRVKMGSQKSQGHKRLDSL